MPARVAYPRRSRNRETPTLCSARCRKVPREQRAGPLERQWEYVLDSDGRVERFARRGEISFGCMDEAAAAQNERSDPQRRVAGAALLESTEYGLRSFGVACSREGLDLVQLE